MRDTIVILTAVVLIVAMLTIIATVIENLDRSSKSNCFVKTNRVECFR